MATSAIDVYWLDIDAEGVDDAGYRVFLSAEECDRASRFRFERDARRYIVRRGHLRQLLARYLDCIPSRIQFVSNPFGKPSVAASDLRFNLSHSHGMALFAIARGREVGCDIEQCDPQFASEQIPERFFSLHEVRALRMLAQRDQTQAFFNCWTRKEAYVKARGCGLSLPLDSFDVSLVPGEPAALLHGCEGWSVRSLAPVTGYQAAVVAQGSDWQLNL
jgi:4'-phosphopantetheinyl transferase